MIGYCLTPSYTLEMPKQCICLGVAEYGSGACVAHLLLSSFITPIFSNIALRSSLVAGRSAPLRRIWCPERVGSNAGAAEWPSYHELPLFLWQKSESANLCQSANYYNWSKIYKHNTQHKHNRNDTDTNNIHTHTYRGSGTGTHTGSCTQQTRSTNTETGKHGNTQHLRRQTINMLV
jgi:hypothetical protein